MIEPLLAGSGVTVERVTPLGPGAYELVGTYRGRQRRVDPMLLAFVDSLERLPP